MAESITMPQLGESVTEGTIIRWLVQIGDKVKQYDPLCEVTTDKVTVEVPSVTSGVITEIVVSEGDTVQVGAVICRIETAEFSPAVWKLIQEHGLDSSQLKGTGRFGRITRNDVMEFLEKRGALVEDMGSPSEQGELEEKVPVTAVRKAIARRMSQSKQEIPHAWTMIECDVTSLVQFRNEIKEQFQRTEGVALTYFPFFMKAVTEALKEFPILNSQWAGEHIILKKEINLSFAVAADRALYTPVIRNADRMDIAGLARTVHQLARKARAGSLTIEDVSGGTFTVNNTGSFGSVLSAPIINYPQAAMLTFEAIVKRPALVDGMLVEIDKVNMCLSMDHRVLDGWVCGQFLQRIRNRLESFGTGTDLYSYSV
ncbi:lipoamide acyltransferase component of branched-chain alpha-keto acid dehydrogenase complex [Paenibacillus montaniterrae]|uniref:Dihydrolipoamide acetyltransferase component of pyruvate dehydrogenase complex n=1 Tax=Paenibacillus montaniterrae TaxID=429341 RepID=A0A919YS05_9BACL|nr:dihydrolipoamide acetyltransferase family protein [Paenibacillus montaniterrae]GIP18630.1 lipoamide acyltransferase component of branched-chain alpha-keto acid dehydrogenase complex [Paenibacillus montaniterrae]